MMYTYSQLSADAVVELLMLHYELLQPIHCQFYVSGLHDNYLIENGGGRFIFRIYRNSWRTQEAIDFELELLAFLDDRTSRVASPRRSKTGELKILIDCAEGQRAGALFSYAEGLAPGNAITEEESLLLGQTVAAVHEISQSFTTPHSRPALDLPYLLDASIVAIEPFLEPEERNYLQSLRAKLHRVLPELPKEAGVFGICLGDVNSSNFHINSDKHITLIDFDQCGYGYRAFEIAKFISSLQSFESKGRLAKAFIDGYQQVRRLQPEEIQAIPCFELVAIIWVMAIHVYNIDRIGSKYLERPFWEQRLSRLKELDSLLAK